MFAQEHELSKRVQSAREAEWEKITQLEQAKLQVSHEGYAEPGTEVK